MWAHLSTHREENGVRVNRPTLYAGAILKRPAARSCSRNSKGKRTMQTMEISADQIGEVLTVEHQQRLPRRRRREKIGPVPRDVAGEARG